MLKFLSSSNLLRRNHLNTNNCYLRSNGYSINPQKTKVPTDVNANTSRMAGIRRLFAYAKPERKKIAVAIGLLIISSSVTVSVPFCLGKVIDLISPVPSKSENILDKLNEKVFNTAERKNQLESHDNKKVKLTRVCSVLLCVFIIGGAANFGRLYILRTSGQRIIRNIRNELYQRMLAQELGFFDKTKTGDLINRLTMDANIMGEGLTQNISDGLRSMLQIVGGVGMMFYVSPKLCTLSLLVIPPLAAMTIVYGRYIKKMTANVQQSLANITQEAEERISNIRTVRAFSHEDLEIQRYKTATNYVLQLTNKETLARAIFFGSVGFGGNAIALSVLYYGGIMMHNELLTVGELSAFLIYAIYVAISMGGMSSFYTELMRGLGAASRVWEVTDRQPEIIHSSAALFLPSLAGHIQLRNVSFAFPTRPDSPAIKDLSLDIAPCTFLAVVGPSGSGKSTIISLLLRLYDPQSGTIDVDGNDLKNLDSKWWRQQIGTVSQDPVLFSSSIAENIAYGLEDPSKVTLSQIENAAKQANALEFIQTLPSGFDTIVGERGVLLSGGQRQRVAIARAVINSPKILFLDEATSSLDAESEYMVQTALEKVAQGRTVISIAHRLSTIRKANQIAVLSTNGQLVELGDYSSLIAKQGFFYKLVDKQMQSYN